MKINGETVNIREIVEVELHRSNGGVIKLKVSGYPIGIAREYEVINPKPSPPVKLTGTTRVGKPPETERDYKDPEYQAAYSSWMWLEKFYFLCKCLEVDSTIKFDNDYNTASGLEMIPVELNAAGFSEGDLGKIMEAMEKATSISDAAIEKAKENFTQSLTTPIE